MTTHDELLRERPDPERDFPRRPMLSAKKREAWIKSRNPYPDDDMRHHIWNLHFFNDQMSATQDPTRSRMAFFTRYLLWPTYLVFVFVLFFGPWVVKAIVGGE